MVHQVGLCYDEDPKLRASVRQQCYSSHSQKATKKAWQTKPLDSADIVNINQIDVSLKLFPEKHFAAYDTRTPSQEDLILRMKLKALSKILSSKALLLQHPKAVNKT